MGQTLRETTVIVCSLCHSLHFRNGDFEMCLPYLRCGLTSPACLWILNTCYLMTGFIHSISKVLGQKWPHSVSSHQIKIVFTFFSSNVFKQILNITSNSSTALYDQWRYCDNRMYMKCPNKYILYQTNNTDGFKFYLEDLWPVYFVVHWQLISASQSGKLF